MVRQAAVASQALAAQAKALRQSVASTRLRQGSADEARALLERALEHISRVGWTQAAADFNDPAGAFVDRDMYVFITDREGIYRLHSAKPANEGKRIGDVPGIDGARFKRPVEPGDQLILESSLERARGGIFKYKTRATVNGELATEAELMCTMRQIG